MKQKQRPFYQFYQDDLYDTKNYGLLSDNNKGVWGRLNPYSAIKDGLFGHKDENGDPTKDTDPKIAQTLLSLLMLALVITFLAPFIAPIFATIQAGAAGLLGASGFIAPGVASVLGYGVAGVVAAGAGAVAIRGSLDAGQLAKDTALAPFKLIGRGGEALVSGAASVGTEAGKSWSKARGLEAKQATKEALQKEKEAKSVAEDALKSDKQHITEIRDLLKSGKATAGVLNDLVGKLKLQPENLEHLSPKQLANLYLKLSRLESVLEVRGFNDASGVINEIKVDLQERYDALEATDKTLFQDKLRSDLVANDSLSQTNHVANDLTTMIPTEQHFEAVLDNILADVAAVGVDLTEVENEAINDINYQVANASGMSRVIGAASQVFGKSGVSVKDASNTNVAAPGANDGVVEEQKREV